METDMIEHRPATFSSSARPYTIDRYAAQHGPAKRPVVVVLHGVDGLGAKSAPEIRKFAEQIAGGGFLVFVPHYFDASDGDDTLPVAALFEVRLPRLASYPPRVAAAIEHALAQTDADGAHLGLVGFSLGGGLALDYAVSAAARKVEALVDFFGYLANPTILANAARLPPTLILHNRADGIVKVKESSQLLLDALNTTSVIHDHKFYDDANPDAYHHPFLPGGDADVDARSRAVAWLGTHLRRTS
jgi:dienelactone hydrolase